MTPPSVRDPKSVYWGPRLALEAIEQRLASLDDAGRRGGACGRCPRGVRGQAKEEARWLRQ